MIVYAQRKRTVRPKTLESPADPLDALIEWGALEERGCAVRRFTLRPGGHPFDRQLDVSAELAEEWRSPKDAQFLVVDEGPGLSGSSFASVAGALRRVGIEDRRIVLMPGWDAD